MPIVFKSSCLKFKNEDNKYAIKSIFCSAYNANNSIANLYK